MSDANTLGTWVNQEKLPNDNLSIENAIILENSSRWCLMIDPQSQANMWIRKKQERPLKVLRQTGNQNEIFQQLELCITQGISVLLENVGEVIDPVFDDVTNPFFF